METRNFFYKKKVLVAGASGFVGTNLSKRLVELAQTSLAHTSNMN